MPLKSFENTGFITYGGEKLGLALINPNLLIFKIMLWVQHSNLLIFKIMLCVMAIECSLHGLVRGENMELGRDSDTGGQVGFSPCLGSSSIFKKKTAWFRFRLLWRKFWIQRVTNSVYFKPLKELATFMEELTVLSRFFDVSIFLRTTIIYYGHSFGILRNRWVNGHMHRLITDKYPSR